MRILSGVQPSGNLHLGNYLGAIRNWVRMQKDAECLFCIVDLLALTQDVAPDALTARTAMYNRMINAPTSIVGHDDLEMYERAQEGLHVDGMEWVNIQRLLEDDEDFDQTYETNGTTERQMRNQFHAWAKFMTYGQSAQEAAE